MADRLNIASGAKWEDIVGYSRAVRVGNLVFVTGTVATDEQGQLVGPGDLYAQTAQALRKIGAALEQAGASFADVVRTRLFVTDISRWEEVARAHREVFGAIKPATSMIEIKALIGPEYLIEIEADAVVGSGG
jgi:enamine deaminase RidA (YjgF/YER057c/UK114 family)